jgi:Raf kinase inhibitor-like YbhB/YbcL family protein
MVASPGQCETGAVNVRFVALIRLGLVHGCAAGLLVLGGCGSPAAGAGQTPQPPAAARGPAPGFDAAEIPPVTAPPASEADGGAASPLISDADTRGPDGGPGVETAAGPPVADAAFETTPALDARAGAGDLHLESTGFLMLGADAIFPRSASYPVDQSPPFTFTGVPATARSLALTFVDQSIGAVKWVVWDIPPQTTGLPANLSKTPHPTELPTSTQRGSLGRTGYSGPGVKGPPLHTYEFQLVALDVATLPGTEGADTVAIRTKILAAHTVAKSPSFIAKGQLGGP